MFLKLEVPYFLGLARGSTMADTTWNPVAMAATSQGMTQPCHASLQEGLITTDERILGSSRQRTALGSRA